MPKSTTEQNVLISVEGYIAEASRYDEPARTVKYLLYHGYEEKPKPGFFPKHGVFPAVMLFFKSEAWEIEVSMLVVMFKLSVTIASVL